MLLSFAEAEPKVTPLGSFPVAAPCGDPASLARGHLAAGVPAVTLSLHRAATVLGTNPFKHPF